MVNIILIHGNGGGKGSDNWFPHIEKEMKKFGIPVIARDFPDSILARSSYWIPFLKNELKADENTVVIGHSSGAVCAMRFAEKNRLLGSILVGACHTDLGWENERISGYYDTPWDWDAIKKNQKWIVEFASEDDPWIPIEEARHIHEKLQTEYYEFTDRGHFGGDREVTEFEECVAVLKEKLHLS